MDEAEPKTSQKLPQPATSSPQKAAQIAAFATAAAKAHAVEAKAAVHTHAEPEKSPKAASPKIPPVPITTAEPTPDEIPAVAPAKPKPRGLFGCLPCGAP